MQTRSQLSPPWRLRPVSAVVLALFAVMGEAAMAADTPPTQLAEVQFNDRFLKQLPGTQVDVSRYNKGNVALAGEYRADVYVNQNLMGRASVTLRQIGTDTRNVQPCFDRSLLERLGIDLSRLTPEALALLANDHGACLRIADLVKDATATFDAGEQRLDVNVPQIAMSRHARGYVDPQFWDDGLTAGMLQYSANAYRSDSLGTSFTSGYLGLNGGFNVGPWRFRHSGNLNYTDQGGTHYQSTQTNLRRGIASMKSQLTIGDAFTDGAVFDSVGFRGVQIASDDRMYPESQRGYAPTIHGIANSNARVQIRQNGNIIYETTVGTGAFEISDLYPTGYGGDLDVIVTEANGSVHISKVPYAPVVNALRPGITRYSVTAGQYRNPSIHVAPYFLQGTIQHGFTNMLTGYGGIQVLPDYFAAQAGVALNTEYGAFGVDLTHAVTKLDNLPDRSGESLRLAYSKLVSHTNTNLTLAAYRYSTGGYMSLQDAMSLRDLDSRNLGYQFAGTQRSRLQLTLNQPLPTGYGNVYVSGSTQDYWGRDGRDTQFQAGYSNTYKRVSYGVTGSRQFNPGTGKWDNRVMLTLGIPLGTVSTAYSTTSVQRDTSGVTSLQETLTGTLGRDNALAYSLSAGHTSGSSATTSFGASGTYVSPYATFTGSASKGNNYSQVSAGVSGGVVAWAGGVALAPNLGDTIAIVDAADAAGARVSSGSNLRVDPWGHAVVPYMTPFSRNQVELDPQGLPLNVELKSTAEQVAPTAGAVVKVRFDTENSGRAAVLRASTREGKPLPFGADVLDAAGQTIGTVAQGGRIIVRGLKTDSGALTVKWGDGDASQCRLTCRLPNADRKKAAAFDIVDATCQ